MSRTMSSEQGWQGVMIVIASSHFARIKKKDACLARTCDDMQLEGIFASTCTVRTKNQMGREEAARVNELIRRAGWERRKGSIIETE